MYRIVAGLIAAISLTACPDKTSESVGDPRDTVWGGQVQALDKARGVEQTVQETAERVRAAETQPGQ